jgi:hypothetical protein
MLTTSSNRHLIQPTKVHKKRRRQEVKKNIREGKRAGSSGSKPPRGSSSIATRIIGEPSATGSSRSGREDLIDLVVEDIDAEEAERVRARKEGGAEWNRDEQKRFVRTYSDERFGEEIRQGFEPSPSRAAAGDVPEFAISDDTDEGGLEVEQSSPTAKSPDGEDPIQPNPWDSPGRPI